MHKLRGFTLIDTHGDKGDVVSLLLVFILCHMVQCCVDSTVSDDLQVIVQAKWIYCRNLEDVLPLTN